MLCIEKYFTGLSPSQEAQFVQLHSGYHTWNSRVNLISRKDMANLYERHILHSLSIAMIIDFVDNTQVLDLGTGGGFPGIPLAIRFPHVRFHLVDSIGKKINAVKHITRTLGLKNVKVKQCRGESLTGYYDFVVSRAVAPLHTLYQWVGNNVKPDSRHSLRNGIICLKGGDLTGELVDLQKPCSVYPLSDYFEESFFASKKVVHVPIHKNTASDGME